MKEGDAEFVEDQEFAGKSGEQLPRPFPPLPRTGGVVAGPGGQSEPVRFKEGLRKVLPEEVPFPGRPLPLHELEHCDAPPPAERP